MIKNIDLLVHNIGELATTDVDHGPARGADMSKVLRVKDASLAVANGMIVAAGPRADVMAAIEISNSTKKIDAGGKVVTAGLIDPHTHLVFGGNRANEFIMRCQGKTYADIANAGGGIVASMRATRKSSVDDLVATGLNRLQRMLSAGTTSCEVKTGYGLDEDSELHMLEAILKLSQLQPVELVPTFMPAHAFPPGCERQEYVRQIIESMLPKAAELVKLHSNGSSPTLFNDVFCDQGYFNLAETREILEAGLRLGCGSKVHADEFVNLGATPLAVELKAASADHLLNVSDQDIEALSKSDTIAVLLPGTSFFLNLKEHAPARKMIEHGVAVGLGSDFNPGSCHIFSLPFIWGLACLHLKLTVEEALTALTHNAAFAIGAGDRLGQLKPGKQADFLIYDVATLEEIPYNLGWNPVAMVFKSGALVHQRA